MADDTTGEGEAPDKYRPLKDAFGRFATGIGIATCLGPDGEPVAITINSFTSVSLEPSLVLWCIEKRASSYPAFMGADHYAVSVLHAGQQAVSDRFASFDPTALAENELEVWTSGAPILKDRLAGYDCRISARHKAGDHVIMIGEVLRFDSRPGEPLVYFASNYHPGFGA